MNIKMQDLINDIDRKFMIDEELKIFFFDDHLEFIDYTSPIIVDGKQIMNEHNGLLLTIYLQEYDIICIEHNSLHMMTPRNRHLYEYLTQLIGKRISDLKQYREMAKENNSNCLCFK